MKHRILLLLLALLMLPLAGYAQSTDFTKNGDGTWTLAAMPNYDVELVVEYVDATEPVEDIAFTQNSDGTWTMNGVMPDYDVELVVEYEDATEPMEEDISFTQNSDGTWTMDGVMPDYDVELVVEYEDGENHFGVWLENNGDNKMAIIRVINENTSYGLKQAKEVVESAPCYVLEYITQEEAQTLVGLINEAGGTAYVRDMTAKALPYTYGFENYDLEGEGWSLVDCDEETWIHEQAKYEGDYGFRFRFNTNPPQYLISPKFEGATGIEMSFYYRNSSNTYPETFQVGYSTTTNSIDAFTWGNEVTANDNTTWKQYEETFPKGTKYVAVKLTSNDKYYLFFDDFCFTEATSIFGDVNGDGLVDISDVVQLVNIILNDGNGGNQAADVNKDHNVDISDVVQLVNIILGN